MNEAEHLADALDGLLTNPDNGWYASFVDAVSGLSAAQAGQAPAQGFNSVWGVVNHVRLCAEVVLLRLRGLPVDRRALGAEDDWPPAGDPDDEAAWQAACERTVNVNRELAALVAGLSAAEIDQPFEPGRARRYQMLHGLIAHNAYHTCEIISVRHMLGLWLENT